MYVWAWEAWVQFKRKMSDPAGGRLREGQRNSFSIPCSARSRELAVLTQHHQCTLERVLNLA